MAIGSWVHVYHNGQGHHQYTTCGNNYLSQDSQNLIFGLGPNNEPIDSLKVVYVSGHIDTYYSLPVDSAYAFTEGETHTVEIETGDVTNLCEGDSILFDAGQHHTYLWSTGDTTSAIIVSESGTYSVVVSNAYGIEASDSINVIFHTNPVITYELTSIPCYGDSTGGISLVNQAQVEPSFVIWDNGMVGASINGLTAGSYQYTFQDLNSCQAIGKVSLEEPPNIVVLTESTPEYAGMLNGTIFVNAFGGTPPYSYFLNEIEVGNYIVLLAAGAYNLEIYDDNLCYEHVEVIVDAILNVEEEEEPSFIIFPNPTTSDFKLNTETPFQSVEILDLQGRHLETLPISSDRRYDISQFANGIYLVKITTHNGKIKIQKVSKL
jgi:hypothetical protein